MRENVVADRLQDYGELLLHHHQVVSVRGRSAVDVLYQSVKDTTTCLEGGGSMGRAFWDVKGVFYNVRSCQVLDRVLLYEPL